MTIRRVLTGVSLLFANVMPLRGNWGKCPKTRAPINLSCEIYNSITTEMMRIFEILPLKASSRQERVDLEGYPRRKILATSMPDAYIWRGS